MKKVDTQEIIKFINDNGYDLINYDGQILQCNEYYDVIEKGTNYLCRVSYSNLKMGKKPIIFGFRNEHYKENMLLYLQNKFPNGEFKSIVQVSKKNNKIALVDTKCKCCQKEFRSNFYDLQKRKYLCCNKCSCDKRGITRRKYDEFFKILHEKGYTVLDKNNTTPKRTDRILVEDSNGYRGYLSLHSFDKKGNMVIFSKYTNKENFIYNINNYCKINNIASEALSLVDNPRYYRQDDVEFKCSCGKTFITSAMRFISEKQIYCKDCTSKYSKNEMMVADFLTQQNIRFIQEFIINSCRDILPLPFDFYLQDYNVLIEIDGVQHFRPTQFTNNQTKEQAEESFAKQKKHDAIKDSYCKKYNIPLLRINYFEIRNNNFKDKILNFIKE